MPIDLQELERLLAKATPGPWRHAIDDTDFGYWWGQAPENGPECLIMANDASGELRSVCCTCDDGIADEGQIANARLIVSAVNALPNLIAEIRELRADRERLDRIREEIGSVHGWRGMREKAQMWASSGFAAGESYSTKDGSALYSFLCHSIGWFMTIEDIAAAIDAARVHATRTETESEQGGAE
jgi:hypothetical protein